MHPQIELGLAVGITNHQLLQCVQALQQSQVVVSQLVLPSRVQHFISTPSTREMRCGSRDMEV